jgi:hypothetical protein
MNPYQQRHQHLTPDSIRRSHHLAFSFLRYCGLSLW